jgi:hypothetical protein
MRLAHQAYGGAASIGVHAVLRRKGWSQMSWLDYLREQRTQKLEQIDALETGNVQLFETTEGVTREITNEQLVKLKTDVAEIRHIFVEEGISFDP